MVLVTWAGLRHMVLSTFLENCSCLAQPYLRSSEATFDKYLEVQYELQKWTSPLHPGLPKNSHHTAHKHSLTCLFEMTDYLDFDLSFLMNQQWHNIFLLNGASSVRSHYLIQWCIYPFTSYVTAIKILLRPLLLQQVKLAETQWWFSSSFHPCTYLPLQARSV